VTQSLQRIPISKPVLDEREVEAVRRVILSGWVTQGPEVAAFERAFAEYVGSPHACAVSNCTTALHLALLAVGVRPGDEVITVSHSFIATANAIRYCGAVPVFVDIEPDTYNIDSAQIEAAITKRTRAILCVHQLGMPCEITSIVRVARDHGLAVVEDAACAIGSEVQVLDKWQRIGKPHGDIACFSFHPRKVLTTGDGGMLTTANAEYDSKFRLWRQHSMNVPDTVRHGAGEVIFESYPEVGFNYRMTDIQAAVGRVQLQRIPELLEERRRLANGYTELLGSVPGLELPQEPEWARSNWQSYCVKLPKHVDQKRTMQRLLDSGISTRRGVMCAHLEAAYLSPTPTAIESLSNSEDCTRRGLMLPLFPGMTRDDQGLIRECLTHALK
jgi:dTDP-4-amino-4,6-dideoxygalactose transaminase